MVTRAGLAATVLVAACAGETVEVRLCPSEALAEDAAVLDRVRFLRVGFQELDGDDVVGERIVQGPAATLSAEGVVESGGELAIWADGLEAADATRPVITGSTAGPVRTGGVRPVCLCMAEPSHWADQCRGKDCELEDGTCRYR